jgi:hypothetical protein
MQKSKKLYPKDKYFYNKCTLTLGKLEEGGIEYIDSVTTVDSRETVLSVPHVDTEGSFVVLIDIESNKKNYDNEQEYATHSEGLSHWRDVVLTVYGTQYCRLDSLALDKNRQMIYDFFLHRIWKDFSRKEELFSEHSKQQVKDCVQTTIFSGNLSEEDTEKQLKIQKIQLGHLTIFKFENMGDEHLILSNIIENRLINHLECFGPFEVNNINPSVIVNANSSEILLFKFSNKIKGIFSHELPKLSPEIDIQESSTSNPEEYYGQDPYEFMTKLYSV